MLAGDKQIELILLKKFNLLTSIMDKKSSAFLQSVETNFDRASELLGLSDDLAKKIKVTNSTYVVRFGVRLRNQMQTFTG